MKPINARVVLAQCSHIRRETVHATHSCGHVVFVLKLFDEVIYEFVLNWAASVQTTTLYFEVKLDDSIYLLFSQTIDEDQNYYDYEEKAIEDAKNDEWSMV